MYLPSLQICFRADILTLLIAHLSHHHHDQSQVGAEGHRQDLSTWTIHSAQQDSGPFGTSLEWSLQRTRGHLHWLQLRRVSLWSRILHQLQSWPQSSAAQSETTPECSPHTDQRHQCAAGAETVQTQCRGHCCQTPQEEEHPPETGSASQTEFAALHTWSRTQKLGQWGQCDQQQCRSQEVGHVWQHDFILLFYCFRRWTGLRRRGGYLNRGYGRWGIRNRPRWGRFGRGRGGRFRRGGGRRQAAPPSRAQLDLELDSYMAGTKSVLDKELDDYMMEAANAWE